MRLLLKIKTRHNAARRFQKTETNNLYYLGFVTLSLQGCATEGKSVALGGAIGAGSGAVLGGIVDPGQNGQYRTRNVIIGSAFGGMVGMASGALLHDNTEEKRKEAFLEGQKSVQNRPVPPPAGPDVSQPKVEIQWVDGKVVGNRYIDGHYERTIVEPARWEAGQ